MSIKKKLRKKKGRAARLPACAGCGERALLRRGVVPICKLCIRLSPTKWMSAVDELKRVKGGDGAVSHANAEG